MERVRRLREEKRINGSDSIFIPASCPVDGLRKRAWISALTERSVKQRSSGKYTVDVHDDENIEEWKEDDQSEDIAQERSEEMPSRTVTLLSNKQVSARSPNRWNSRWRR